MTEKPHSDSIFGWLLQLFWTLVGPGLLMATGSLLIVNHPPFGSRPFDRKPSPEGTPGSRLKYLVVLAAAVIVILALAHLVAPRFA